MANNDNQGTKKQEAPGKDDQVGEGNHDADRRYRDATQEYVKSGRPDAAGKEASRALDNDRERKDLEDAERRARSGATSPGQRDPGPASHRGPGKDDRGDGGGSQSKR